MAFMAMKFLMEFVKKEPIKSIIAGMVSPPSADLSDKELTEYIEETWTAMWHQIGQWAFSTQPLKRN